MTKRYHPADDYKLDNPVWYSLSEVHQELGGTINGLKFYKPLYCPFAGYKASETITADLDEYANLTDKFFVVGEEPPVSKRLRLEKELVCLQMVSETNLPINTGAEIVYLNNSHAEELFQLVNFVQPGYFTRDTISLGDYYGIFKDDHLVAAAGERMKMNTFTEVSAIVTHPDYSGRGFASQLTSYVMNKIMLEGKTPYLHVAERNDRAIRLYQKLGFEIRRRISFWYYELLR